MATQAAESALDNLINADWWDDDHEASIHRVDTGEIILFTRTEVYFIGWGGAITRQKTDHSERVFLD